MTLALSAAHNAARLAGTVTFADSGTQNSRIRLYATTQPATGADPGGTPLVEILLAKPCGTITNGVLALEQADPGGDLATATGSALWARWINGDDALVADADVTDSEGTGTIKLAGGVGTLIFAGAYVRIGTTDLS